MTDETTGAIMTGEIAETTGEAVAVEAEEVVETEAEEREDNCWLPALVACNTRATIEQDNQKLKQVTRNYIRCYNRKEQSTGRCRKVA